MNTQTIPKRIAFQGEPGAFSEEAAIALLGEAVQTVPRPTFDSLFAAIHDGAAEAILAPIENSLAGTIPRVCDLLWDCELSVQAETVHPIRHCLIGAPGATLQSIRSVQSHPAALAQCENYFLMHPQITRIAADDTAGSVRQIVEARDVSVAAIASRRAATLHGGVVLREALEDDPQNYTRFLLLAPRNQQPAGANKLTVLLHLAHRPGTLHRALDIFARAQMNLLKIESRPLVGRPWHYRFFLDVQTPPERAAVDAALDALRKETEEMRILGWYRAAAVPAARITSDAPAGIAAGAAR